MTDAVRQPRTTEQAQALLEQYATLDGEVAAIEENRRACIADVNKRCDTAVHDLVVRRDAIAEKLAPWWDKASGKLTEGKRKSIELGGCMIGSRTGPPSLAVDGDEKSIVAKLLSLRWAAKTLLRVSISLDRKAILKALEGKRHAELKELGLSRREGSETFVLERVQQEGTLGGA